MPNHPHLYLMHKFLSLRPISRYSTNEVIDAAKLLVPYALGEAGDGKFVILNRSYKPLGIEDQLGGFVDYRELPEFLKITSEQVNKTGIPTDWVRETGDIWPGYLGTKRRAIHAAQFVRSVMEALK